MRSWFFIVRGAPRGKGRPRFGKGRTYTDDATAAYERTVRDAALLAMRGVVVGGPVAVDTLIVLPRPKRFDAARHPDGFIWAPVKPDLDNVRKAVFDGLKRHLRDDAQVCAGPPFKVYAERGGKPRVEVTVRELPDDPELEIQRWRSAP